MNLSNKYTKILDKGFIGLISHLGSDESIEQAARVSYAGNNKKKDTGRLIRYLMRKKHWSPFEMCEAIFHVKLPLFSAQQWTRHRASSFNFLSFRYCEPKEEVYIPNWREQAKKNKQASGEEIDNQELNLLYEDSINMSFGTYRDLINNKVSRELARSVIPTSTYTECYVKCDLRNWFNFISLRSDSHAQYEIQVYSDFIGSCLKELFPESFKAFVDYSFNSINFTHKELQVILKAGKYGETGKLESKEDIVRYIGAEYWDTDSELEEFVAKINKKDDSVRFNIQNYNLETLEQMELENV